MDENYIKVDGEPDEFEGGATRYSKRGKGRYDLIPNECVYWLLAYGEKNFAPLNELTIAKSDILKDAYDPEDSRYYQAIFSFVCCEYSGKTEDSCGCIKLEYMDWFKAFNRMLKDLAIHYEFGAEKYGIDNWKNGIPITGGDRGGSFTDSGRRHLTQYFLGETDEKHGVAFMWNYIGALWLQLQKPSEDEPLNERGHVSSDEVFEFKKEK